MTITNALHVKRAISYRMMGSVTSARLSKMGVRSALIHTLAIVAQMWASFSTLRSSSVNVTRAKASSGTLRNSSVSANQVVTMFCSVSHKKASSVSKETVPDATRYLETVRHASKAL